MGIGIFGGTFDPVHLGHLRAAEEIRESFGLERVYFVPASVPPHKRGKRIAGTDQRIEMLKIAIRGNAHLRLSELEIKRGGVSYSIDTVETFEKKYDEIYFILGVDAFLEIGTWRRYDELFSHAHFIIMLRPMEGGQADFEVLPEAVRRDARRIDASTLEHVSGRRIYLKRVTQLDISSTRIREASRQGKSIKYLVPDKVERFIDQRGLYKT
jgi:nicotinate-nucleotide adenylyltransferase